MLRASLLKQAAAANQQNVAKWLADQPSPKKVLTKKCSRDPMSASIGDLEEMVSSSNISQSTKYGQSSELSGIHPLDVHSVLDTGSMASMELTYVEKNKPITNRCQESQSRDSSSSRNLKLKAAPSSSALTNGEKVPQTDMFIGILGSHNSSASKNCQELNDTVNVSIRNPKPKLNVGQDALNKEMASSDQAQHTEVSDSIQESHNTGASSGGKELNDDMVKVSRRNRKRKLNVGQDVQNKEKVSSGQAQHTEVSDSIQESHNTGASSDGEELNDDTVSFSIRNPKPKLNVGQDALSKEMASSGQAQHTEVSDSIQESHNTGASSGGKELNDDMVSFSIRTNTARTSQATRMLISRNRKTGAGSRQEMLHYINNSIDRNGLESRFISSFKGKLNFKIFDHLHWILNDLDECIVLRVVDLFSMLKC